MEPNQKERLLQETAQLLIYVRMNTKSGIAVDKNLRAAAADQYCRKDYVAALCSAIRGLSEEDLNRIVYDGRNPQARKLADWWEKHLEADRIREEKERKEAEAKALVDSALSKLTAVEMVALRKYILDN
jgi:hypothetical protein